MEGRYRNLGPSLSRAACAALGLLAAAAFPHHCLACGAEGKVICEGCAAAELVPLEGIFVCPGCAAPSPLGARCGKPRCRAATPLDGIVSAAPYARPVLRGLLRLWKYERVDEAGRALLGLFAGFARRHGRLFAELLDGATVASVPMHRFRRAYRGFDQAALLAEAFRGETGARDTGALLRRRFRWSAQAVLGDDARRRNARGSAAVVGPVVGRSFVLIDDVATTGATLAACAGALKEAGAGRVWAVTLLRG